jgi:hypothetical protein
VRKYRQRLEVFPKSGGFLCGVTSLELAHLLPPRILLCVDSRETGMGWGKKKE